MWRSSPPVRLGIGVKALGKRSGKLHKNGRRHGRMQCFLFLGAGAPVLNYDKLSRSNEEANSLSKEDVIEIEGIVREAMPNAIFKVEMLSEDKNTGKLTPSGHILLAHISGKLLQNRAQARQSTVLSGLERKAPAPYHDKLSRSK